MAWLLITAMPVIHAHSATLGMMHHTPITTPKTLELTQLETTSTHVHIKTETSYKCPLCDFSPLLFGHEVHLPFTQYSFSSLQFSKLATLHSLTILFKPARAPPSLIV